MKCALGARVGFAGQPQAGICACSSAKSHSSAHACGYVTSGSYVIRTSGATSSGDVITEPCSNNVFNVRNKILTPYTAHEPLSSSRTSSGANCVQPKMYSIAVVNSAGRDS